ncbi:MAG: hypothetical protein GX248_12065 [Peptococcaceae bacterium]|jgi:hypothetical protein|nr:hypothetical protein [Peptococcaceae bacterium]
MATSSIFNDVRIKRKSLGRNFVKALENAEKIPTKDVILSKRVQEVKGESIKKLFGKIEGN